MHSGCMCLALPKLTLLELIIEPVLIIPLTVGSSSCCLLTWGLLVISLAHVPSRMSPLLHQIRGQKYWSCN